MINQKNLQIIKENSLIQKFLSGIKNFEISLKKLNLNEIKRLSREYPDLLKLKQLKIEKLTKDIDKIPSIICLTIVKSDIEIKNYEKLKKLKIYFDESNTEIIKILKN